MSTIKELRDKQAEIATQARAKFDEINDDTKASTAADIEREFDKMMLDHDAIGSNIERLIKIENIEKALGEPITPAARGVDGQAIPIGIEDAPTYRDAFNAYIRVQGQVGAMDADLRQVLAVGYAPVEARAQTTTATAGGYTVPTEMAAFITKSMAMWGPMYDPNITSEMITSGGGAITLPTVNDTSRVVVKHVEGTTLTDDGGSDVTFGEKTLNAYPFNTEWLRVSKELADDSVFNIEQFLAELLGEGLGRRANTELTTGDGTGDPNGIVTASALGKTAAAVAAITVDELIDLIHSVDPAYRGSPKARFMMNDTVFAAIRKLKNSSGEYLWQPNIAAGAPPTLLDQPYSINQAMPAMATGLKPIVFGDFGKYYVRKVGSPMIGAIQDKDFWPGFGIAGYIRFDGELADTAAVKHLIMA